jgi:hypothetical protein
MFTRNGSSCENFKQIEFNLRYSQFRTNFSTENIKLIIRKIVNYALAYY